MDSSLYVGFSRSTSLLARVILWFTKGDVNHAFLCWQDVHLGWVALGANANGVTLDTWDNFLKDHTVAAIFAPTGVTTLWYGLQKLESSINASYNIPALVGMSVVEVASHVFHKNVGNPLDVDYHDVFCSEFALMVIRASGYSLFDDRAADTIDPQTLMTELKNRTDFAQGVVPVS